MLRKMEGISTWQYFFFVKYIFPMGFPFTFSQQTDCNSGAQFTFAEVRHNSIQLANVLRTRFAIGKGDVLLCLLPNSIHYPIILLAGALIGAPVAGAAQLSEGIGW